MGLTVIFALGLRGAGAAAWLAYSWILTRLLDPVALGQVLYALAFAGFLAALISAGWAQVLLREGSRYMQDETPARMGGAMFDAVLGALKRITIVAIAMTVATFAGLLPEPISEMRLAVLTIAIASVFALVLIHAAAQRACGHLLKSLTGPGLLLAAMPLGFCGLLTMIQPLSSVAALLIHLMSLCLTLIWLRRGIPKDLNRKHRKQTDHQALRDLGVGQVGHVLLTHMDVLILGWTIGAIEAGIYLIVRRIAGLLSLVFDALRSAVAPKLSVAFHQNRADDITLGVNRLFLFVGVGVGLFLAASAEFILPIFGAENAIQIFYWLVLGGISPAIFGATGLLMMMANMERSRLYLIAVLLPISILTLLWAAQYGPTDLARATALMQGLLGASGALILQARHGIRPGLISFGQRSPQR